MQSIQNFFRGAHFFLHSLKKLVRHPSLLGLSLIPIFLTLVVLGAILWGGLWIAGAWLQRTFALAEANTVLLQAFLAVVILYVAYLIYLPLTRIFLAPVSERLSARTSKLNGNTIIKESELGFFRAIFEGVKLVLLQLLLVALIFPLTVLIPPVGIPLAIFATICFCGMDFLDVPLSLRLYPFKRKLAFIRANFAMVLGFSVAAYLLLHLPVLNLLALPMGVIGATGMIEQAQPTKSDS